MKITRFDRPTIKALRTPIEDALKDLATKHGIVIKVGNGSYTEATVTFKLELATIDKTGTVQSKEAQDFKMYALLFGLKTENLGQSFLDYSGEKFTVIGAKPRSTKFPILVEDSKGKRFKFPANRVQLGLQRSPQGT